MQRSAVSQRLRSLLGFDRTSAEVYSLLDWPLAVRIGGVLWLIGSVSAGVVVPFASPTHLVGRAGWLLVASVFALGIIAGSYLVARPDGVRPLHLLVMGYAAAAGLAVGQALIGPSAEFALPFLLLVGYQASVHPARRLLPLLGCVVLLETASNLVGSTAAVDVAQMVSGIVLLVLITAMAMIHAESNRSLAGRLSFVALHDGLTGLPNRALVIDRAGQILARARRQHRPVAAFYIDLDGFKRINDTYGHATGDQLLCVVAARLSGVIRDADTVGRLGGDEFAVLLDTDTVAAGCELVAERLLEILRQPVEIDQPAGTVISVSASIGIATGQHASADELLGDADLALYACKQAGKNRYAFFEDSMQIAVADRRALDLDLTHALQDNQLFLRYQPIFDLQSQLVTGAEALIRWRHPVRGVLEPQLFIPVAEENGLIVSIGAWVLKTACAQAATWQRRGYSINMSVNVSARQLHRDQFVDEVAQALEQSGLDARALTLEIAETVLMRDHKAGARRLEALKPLGVRIAIDDFGTGYSSLAYLRQFPVDALKIDRTFISGISSNKESAVLMHTLVQLGKTLGLETLGEGIEDRSQLERLRRERCDSGQGFLFARPLGADAIEEFFDTPNPGSPQAPTISATSG